MNPAGDQKQNMNDLCFAWASSPLFLVLSSPSVQPIEYRPLSGIGPFWNEAQSSGPARSKFYVSLACFCWSSICAVICCNLCKYGSLVDLMYACCS
jgi:hypothetical protein